MIASAAAFVVAIALALASALTAHASTNATKRLVAVIVALFAALLALAALGAPQTVLIAGGAFAFAYCVIGVAIVVRLQEAYGGVEVADFDAADDASEPRERAP
jgi:hypothetical protein